MLPVPPPRTAAAGSAADRLARGEALVGALARTPEELAFAERCEVDLVVVPPALLGIARRPVLLLVEDAATPDRLPERAAGLVARAGSAAEVAALRRVAGADGLVVLAAPAPVPVADVAAVLTGAGAHGCVSSSEEARAVLSTGARLAVYDVAAVLAGVAAELTAVRPREAELLDRVPLVLLSGMLGDASLWDAVSAELADAVRPMPLRIDLDDSVPAMAESVLAAAPDRFALAGHSLGGIVALEILRQAPERVSAVALIATSARGPSAAQQQAWAEWGRRTEAGEFGTVARELAAATLPPTRRADAALRALNEAMAGTVGTEGFRRQLAAQSTRPDSREWLGDIAVPAVVVSGAEDDVCPPELQEEIVRLCPGAELVTLPGGHMLPLECPGELAAVLRHHVTAPADAAQ